MTPEQWDRVEWAVNEVIAHAMHTAFDVLLAAVVMLVVFVTLCKLGIVQ